MNFRKQIAIVRVKVKSKDYFHIMKEPKLVFFFVLFSARSVFLRITPQKTRFYFISQEISKLIFKKVKDANKYAFSVFNKRSNEILEYIKTRCNEDLDIFELSYNTEINNRFQKGDIACCLLENNIIVCILFISLNKEYINDINFWYNTDKDEALVKDIYTIKKKRQLGLYNLLLEHTSDYLKITGISKVTMWVMKHNKATTIAQTRVGFEKSFQTVEFFTWFCFKKTTVKKRNTKLSDL